MCGMPRRCQPEVSVILGLPGLQFWPQLLAAMDGTVTCFEP